MQYLVLDDGVQPRMWVCETMEQINALALPAHERGCQLYLFPSETQARAGFPHLVQESHPPVKGQQSAKVPGFMERIRGAFRPAPKPLLPRLLAANERELIKLCRENREEILANFTSWQVVPAETVADPGVQEFYIRGIGAIARCFADSLSDDRLLGHLRSAHTRMIFEDHVRQAQEHFEEMRYDDVIKTVQLALEDSNELVEERPYMCALFATGAEAFCHGFDGVPSSLKGALDSIDEALKYCDDLESQIQCNITALEISRYAEDRVKAESCAVRLAELSELTDPEKARYYRTQARKIAQGEPLLRAQVMLSTGARYELDEISQPLLSNGSIRVILHRNRATLIPCQRYTEVGKQLGGAGQFEKALEYFQAAAEADPHDPDCHFQAGYTLLYLRRYQEAAEACSRADQLAPSWFNCKLDTWLAELLHQERLEYNLWLALNQLEEERDEPTARLARARQIAGHAGRFGLFHLHVGNCLLQLNRSAEAEATYRIGLGSDLESSVRTRLLVALAMTVGDPGERQALRQEAVELQGHLLSSTAAFISLRSEA